MIDFAHQQRTGTSTLAATCEVDRIRSLLNFALAMDYQCNDKASLSALDRDHFTTMSNLLFDLKQSSKHVAILASERHQLATYFWKYLHEPCKSLDIPPESVLICISRILKYSNSSTGNYHGCCFNILQDCGLDDLAAKVYLDQRILIPRVIEDLPTRHRMHAAVAEFRALYFTRIYGIEGSTEAGFVNARGWAHLQTIVYDASERGKTLERLRNETSLAASIQLSLRHWVSKASRCVEAVTKRSKQSQAGRAPTPRWGYPFGWRVFNDDTSLPNFIEERRLESGTLM